MYFGKYSVARLPFRRETNTLIREYWLSEHNQNDNSMWTVTNEEVNSVVSQSSSFLPIRIYLIVCRLLNFLIWKCFTRRKIAMLALCKSIVKMWQLNCE